MAALQLAFLVALSISTCEQHQMHARIEPVQVEKAIKERLELRLVYPVTDIPITQCIVVPPRGVPIPVAPGGTTNPRYKYVGNGYEKGDCGVRVQPVTREDDGQWTLSARYKDHPNGPVFAVASVSVKEYSTIVVPDITSRNEGDVYNFQLDTKSVISGNDTELSSCVAISPAGERIQLAPSDSSEMSVTRSRIEYLPGAVGQDLSAGACGASVKDILGSDEGHWVLEATHKSTGIVYRGSSLLTVYVPQMDVVPRTISAQEHDFAILKLVPAKPTPKKQESWIACLVVAPDGRLLQLTGQPQANATSDSKVLYAGEEGLRNGDCKAKIGPLDNTHAGKWMLLGIRATGARGRAQATIEVLTRPTRPQGTAITAILGSAQKLTCGPDNALKCSLSDPSGAVVSRAAGQCEFSLTRVRFKDVGNWTCKASVPGFMLEVDAYTKLSLRARPRVHLKVVQTDKTAFLKCRLDAADGVPGGCGLPGASWCRMERPNGTSLLLREGVLGTGDAARYTYSGVGISACDCSMTIEKPLLVDDLGVWRCIIGSGHSDKIRGGFLTVMGANPTPVPVVNSTIRNPSSGIAANGSEITVGCRVNRALSYCWLQAPNGAVFTLDDSTPKRKPQDNSVELWNGGAGLDLGECVLRLRPASSATHSGTWKCGLGLASEDQTSLDMEVNVDMYVSDSLMAAKRSNVTVAEGETAVLECRTAFSEGLDYCRFHMPNGSSLHLSDLRGVERIDGSSDLRETPRFMYHGAGLKTGACGLAIGSVHVDDFGLWTCSAHLAGDVYGYEQQASIVLTALPQEPREMSTASVIGLCLGLLSVGLLVGTVVGYRILRYRVQKYTACQASRSGELVDVATTSPRLTGVRVPPLHRSSRSHSDASATSHFTDDFTSSDPVRRRTSIATDKSLTLER